MPAAPAFAGGRRWSRWTRTYTSRRPALAYSGGGCFLGRARRGELRRLAARRRFRLGLGEALLQRLHQVDDLSGLFRRRLDDLLALDLRFDELLELLGVIVGV